MRIPFLPALIIFIIAAATDLYIYLDIRRNTERRALKLTYIVTSVILWIFIGVCLALPRRDASESISFQMWGIYAFLSIYFPKIIFMLFSIIGGIPRLWKGKTWKTGLWVGLPVACIIFVAMWWGALVTRKQIEITRVEIKSPKIPSAFNGYRIVQISDLHVGTWGNDTRFIEQLCDSINSLNPDVIFFTGDIVNRDTHELQPFLTTLSTLHAKDGIYSVLGNHDYGDYVDWNSPHEKQENLELLKNWERQIGWTLLNNSRAQLVRGNDTIQVIGVENWGEPPFRQYGNIIDAYPISRDSVYNLNDNRYKILLSHNPEHWLREVVDISNIDLTLSGHTHAMQCEFKLGKWKWSPSALRYSLWGGLYERTNKNGEKMQIYVNIGAGEVGMPFRIGATPEITLIELGVRR